MLVYQRVTTGCFVFFFSFFFGGGEKLGWKWWCWWCWCWCWCWWWWWWWSWWCLWVSSRHLSGEWRYFLSSKWPRDRWVSVEARCLMFPKAFEHFEVARLCWFLKPIWWPEPTQNGVLTYWRIHMNHLWCVILKVSWWQWPRMRAHIVIAIYLEMHEHG